MTIHSGLSDDEEDMNISKRRTTRGPTPSPSASTSREGKRSRGEQVGEIQLQDDGHAAQQQPTPAPRRGIYDTGLMVDPPEHLLGVNEGDDEEEDEEDGGRGAGGGGLVIVGAGRGDAMEDERDSEPDDDGGSGGGGGDGAGGGDAMEDESDSEPDDDGASGGAESMDVEDDAAGEEDFFTFDLVRLINIVLDMQSRAQDWVVETDEYDVYIKYQGPDCLVDRSHSHHDPGHSAIVFNPRTASLGMYCADSKYEFTPVPGYIMPGKTRYGRDADRWAKHDARTDFMYLLYARFGREMTPPVRREMQLCFNRALQLPENTSIWTCTFNCFNRAVLTGNARLRQLRLSIGAEGYDFDSGRIIRDMGPSEGKKKPIEVAPDNVSSHDNLVNAWGKVPVGVGRMLLSLFEIDFYTRPIAVGGDNLGRVMWWVNETLEIGAIYKDDRNIFYAPRADRPSILDRIAQSSQEMVEHLIKNKAPQDIKDAAKQIPRLKTIWEGVDSRRTLFKQPALRACWAFKNGIYDYPMSPDHQLDDMKALFIEWENLPKDTECFLPIKEFDFDFDPGCFESTSTTPNIDAVLGGQLEDNMARRLFTFFMGRLTLQPYWSEQGIFDNLQCFPYLSGMPATGKSTFVRAIVQVAFRNARIIGEARAAGGTIGGKAHLKGADFIYNEELNDDPKHKLWQKLTPNFFKNLARMEKVEIDALYKENEDVVLRAGLFLLSNHRYMGVERLLSGDANGGFSALKAVERSFVPFHFPNEVPADRLDSSLGAKLVKEMPAFLAKAQWQYISLRRNKEVIPELMWFNPYVKAQMEERLRELHPICRFLAYCERRQQETKDGEKALGIIYKNVPGQYVNAGRFKLAFRLWAKGKIPDSNPADEKGAFDMFGFTVLDDEQTFLCRQCADNVTGFKLGPCDHTDKSQKVHARKGWIINASIDLAEE